MKEKIFTPEAPIPVGPYSQAVKFGNLLFVSGQVALNQETKQVEGDIEQQTRAVLTNLGKILSAAGSGMEDVLKTTIFLADMGDFPRVNQVYASFFGETPPARSTIQVAKLPLGALVEIEAIAFVP
ncbi:MAG TPA: RidA family protein [Desulfomonilaceae bacterium]|nr:RidA family protein [Desulfomonilaceae bacterium]